MSAIHKLKKCISCRKLKEVSEFHSDSSRGDGLNPECNVCAHARRTRLDRKHPEKARARAARYRAKYPKRQPLINRKTGLKRKFGISFEEYEARYNAQKGCCAICGHFAPLIGSCKNRGLAVDHDHRISGIKIRGLLCLPCNRILGLAKDNPEHLRKAADYLVKNS